MHAVKVVRHLLANNVGLTALVPAVRIMAGDLPQGTSAPAIEVRHISTVPRNTVRGDEASQFLVSRVQVGVVAASYRQMQDVLDAVRAAIPRSRGTVHGVNVDSILPDTIGPDFADGSSGLFSGSLDFIVRFNT